MYNLLVAVYNDRNNMPATALACQFDATNDPTGMGRAWAIGLDLHGQRRQVPDSLTG